MTTAAAAHPILDSIAGALGSGDRDALARLYAPEAEYTSTGGAHPPARPLRLVGSAAIGDYLRGIPPEIEIVLHDSLVGTDGRVMMATTCRFPGGGRAITSHVMRLDAEGRIASHHCVEAVDG